MSKNIEANLRIAEHQAKRTWAVPKFQRTLLLVALSLFIPLFLLSQPKDNAPYSRIGLGEPTGNLFSSGGFGGLTAAYADPLHLNYRNPASLAWLNATVFEAGLFGEYSNLKFSGESNKVWTGNLSHLALAFPIFNELNDLLQKRERKFFWSSNVALLPVTTIGYDINTTQFHPLLDTVLNVFQGSGGTNHLLVGNGFRIGNFSAGFNISHLFGQIEGKRQVAFTNLDASYSDKFIDNISLRGWIWSFGVMQKILLDKKKAGENFYNGRSLTLGLYGNNKSSFQTKTNVYRIRENFSYAPIQSDTLFRQDDVQGSGKLPAEFTIGLMYDKFLKFRVGLEYSFAKWSQYKNEAKPESLYDSKRVAIGAEYIPNAASYNNFFQRIRYRAGFYLTNDPRLENLNQYALTLGLGLPVILPRQQTSFVNLMFDIGKYNTEDGIQETFVKIGLGFTLNDNSWFFKRKYG
jgi:hypothetical protein